MAELRFSVRSVSKAHILHSLLSSPPMDRRGDTEGTGAPSAAQSCEAPITSDSPLTPTRDVTLSQTLSLSFRICKMGISIQ